MYLAAPLSDRLTFGFNVTAPFGLGTQYPKEALTRYAATRSQVVGIDIGPSLGFMVNDYLSVGAGFDALRLDFTLSNMYGPPLSLFNDTALENKLHGWGYGGHAGVLLNLPSKTKIGFSYYSQIAIDTDGFSTVYLPSGAQIGTRLQETDATLPARAQLSAQQDLNDRWTAMATAFYTNWKTFKELTMKRTMIPTGQLVPVTIPFNYHNCFDYAVGTTYKATEKVLLRAGLEFMNTPSNDVDRGIADPIGGATVVGVGAHYQYSSAISYDVGVGHSFFKQQSINFSNSLTSLKGKTTTQTTVIGAQLNWNFN
jgi:long-chain fatty acid transport protein